MVAGFLCLARKRPICYEFQPFNNGWPVPTVPPYSGNSLLFRKARKRAPVFYARKLRGLYRGNNERHRRRQRHIFHNRLFLSEGHFMRSSWWCVAFEIHFVLFGESFVRFCATRFRKRFFVKNLWPIKNKNQPAKRSAFAFQFVQQRGTSSQKRQSE